MSGRLIGTLAGAAIGAIAGYFIGPVGPYLGASLGAAEGSAPALPQFPCPPGMEWLLTPLLGLPFVLGGRDPDRGGLDCAGLVLYAYREGLGIPLEEGVNPTLVSLGAIRRKNRQMKELSDDLLHPRNTQKPGRWLSQALNNPKMKENWQ